MATVSPSYFLRGFHVLQVFLAGYGAFNSYIAIKNLREYEDTTRKAAKWSSEVQTQLSKTHNTQGAGVLSIALSITASVALAVFPSYLPSIARIVVSPAMLAGLFGVRQYMKSYWGGSGGTRVPLPMLGDYNDAQRQTKVIIDVLEWLQYSWIATTLGWALLR